MVTIGLLTVTSNAYAYTTAERYEQYRYARETIDLTYKQYVARQKNFVNAGCKHIGAADCTKPSPYDAFDWDDDGCSGREEIGFLSLYYRNFFNEPCRLHDFGYRNFGKGLTLYRHEDMRAYIDARFKSEMFRLCNDKYPGLLKNIKRLECQNLATAMYGAIRNHPSNDWGTSGTAPRVPDYCPGGDYSGSDADGTCGTPPPVQDYCPGGDYSGSAYDGTCGTPPPAASIQLSQGAPATYGYWYSVSISGFTPGAQISLTCRDSVDPGGFWSQTFTVDGAGRAGDTTLCYSGDHPDHWVTSSNGFESNHVAW